MGVDVWREIGDRLLDQAADVRLAYPDAAAMGQVSIDRQAWPVASHVFRPLRAALDWLRDEMLLVQSGAAGTLAVLDDEAGKVADELACL